MKKHNKIIIFLSIILVVFLLLILIYNNMYNKQKNISENNLNTNSENINVNEDNSESGKSNTKESNKIDNEADNNANTVKTNKIDNGTDDTMNTEESNKINNEIGNDVNNKESDKVDNNTDTELNNKTGINTKEQYNTEIFDQYYSKAEAILNTMTLEEKVGQMFLARYPGTELAINEIKSENPGGYILFGKDFKNKTKNSVMQELKNIQSSSKINLLLGVDEEGGTVVRVSGYTNFRKSKFKSPQELWNDGGLQAILNDSSEKSNLLKSLGLNMNLAPVVDVPTNSSSFIFDRSYGKDAKDTSIYTSEIVKKMNKDKIISSMKHFPGYGDNVDTHTGIAVDNRDYSNFETNDFLPFISGIEAGGPTILVNHNIVNCMDSSKPASLSEKVHKILREDLNFSGLIITDDLAMAAVKKYVTNGEAAVQAVMAGNDMIISSDFKIQKQEVIKAVKDGRISEEIIDEAVRRILACKYAYGIIIE